MRRVPLVSREEILAAPALAAAQGAAGSGPIARAAGAAVMNFAAALAELPRGEYRVVISITRIRRRKDGSEKRAELVRETVSDFKKSNQRRRAP